MSTSDLADIKVSLLNIKRHQLIVVALGYHVDITLKVSRNALNMFLSIHTPAMLVT